MHKDIARKTPAQKATELGLIRCRYLLQILYRQYGPMDNGRKMPFPKYAAMSTRQVNKSYDFRDRHLMHAVAKALVMSNTNVE